MRNLGIFLLPFTVGVLLFFLSLARTDLFEEGKIDGRGVFQDCRNSPQSSSTAEGLLSRPFYYLGHGRQCYAFESQDGQYVVKFFNFSSNHKPSFLERFKLPSFLEKIFLRKEKRGKAFFRGYFLDDLLKDTSPKMTATLLVQLGRGSSHKDLALYDKWHQMHHVHLDETAFVLQRKVYPFFSWLQESLFQEDLFRERIAAYVDLIFSRLERGIFDPDGRLLEHIGLVDGSLVFFDQGRIFFEKKLEEPSFRVQKMKKETQLLRKFLLKEHPEKLKILEEEIAKRQGGHGRER